MKLNEFFSPPEGKLDDKNPRDQSSKQSEHEKEELANEVYWYMLDDDELHKEYFVPLAHEISGLQKSKKFEHNEFIKRWMPMVKAACIKFYKEHEEDLSGDPNDLFSKDMRKVLCQRLADQHHKDIEAGEYKLS